MSDDPVLSALARLEAGQGAIQADLTRLEAGQDAMQAHISRLEAGQDAMQAHISRLEAGQAAIRTDVAAIRAELESIRVDLVHLEAGMAALRAEFASYRTGLLDELGATRAVMIERIQGVQGAIAQLKDDISVNMGAVDSARQMNETTRDDLRQLREQVGVMWRQLKAVQEEVTQLKSGR